ncbi:hypothetical protein quinque_013616 [Culex quinquefasciatus]
MREVCDFQQLELVGWCAIVKMKFPHVAGAGKKVISYMALLVGLTVVLGITIPVAVVGANQPQIDKVFKGSTSCPTETTCVPPLQCTTMMMDRTNLVDESMTPRRRCRINANFDGICCPQMRNDEDNDSEENSRFSPAQSSEINHGRKSGQRNVPDLLLGNDTSDNPHIRTKRCLVGGDCLHKHLRYRRYDGKCNNVLHGRTLWGSAGYPMERILPPAYGNGVWSARVLSVTGNFLPSARSVSASLFGDLHVPHSKHNVLIMQFGQFLVHDITKNKGHSDTAKCCLDDGSHRVANPHPACLPIPVSKVDPFYSQFGVRCLEFVRTAVASRQNCNVGHGRQISAVTHFIDGSGIYGSSAEDSILLRALEGGRLKSLKHVRLNNELPPLDETEGACDKKSEMCFKVGDDRVNQLITLVAVHTLFLREHNRIAKTLDKLNPHWSDETIFQETRRIVIAEIQHIVFNEYLPNVVGPNYMQKYELHPSKGYSNFYNPKVNPSILSEFSAAAFRFGHSTIPDYLELPGGLEKTHKTFFDPTRLREPHFFDGLFRGILHQPQQLVDDMFSHSVTWFLNPKEGFPFGKDLVSLNIQRGRDHALPSYNHYLHLNERHVKNEFSHFGAVVSPKLADLYDHPDDVDLYVGGILETPISGAVVGETFAEIISDQFARLKEGDRYFYSERPHTNPGHFTLPQLEEIQKITLAGLLCANANDRHSFHVQPQAFDLPHHAGNQPQSCHSNQIPSLDLNWWKD